MIKKGLFGAWGVLFLTLWITLPSLQPRAEARVKENNDTKRLDKLQSFANTFNH